MEQHSDDPTSADPWTEATARWSGISEGFRRRYRDLVGEDGPDEEAVRDAIRTLGEAAQSVVASIGTAMRDPEVRAQVKDAAASLVSALGTTFDELGDELRRTFAEEERDADAGAGEVAGAEPPTTPSAPDAER